MFNTLCQGARWALLAALTVFCQSAMALGLGNASVESYLEQPLRAKIDFIVRETDDLGSVTVSLASAEDFALIGASRAAISVPLSFAVEQEGGRAVIVVSSNLPVKDPVIRLIIEVNWSSGRMLREYTLFLDPPTFAAAAPPPVIDQRKNPPAAPVPVRQPESLPAEPETAPVQDRDESASRSTAAEVEVEMGQTDDDVYGPVQSGDTLWRIAANWSGGSGQDINAVMVAIQRNNPQAFIKDNINLLKQGVILRMPQIGEISQISSGVARNEVEQQSLAFNQQAGTLAVETPLVDESSEAPDDVLVDEDRGPDEDLLELVPPSEDADVDSAYGLEESLEQADASTGIDTLREELARKEEALIIEQQQNEYLQERIAELEGQLAVGEDATVADADMAQMESRLREERLSPDATASAADLTSATEEATKPAVPKVTSTKTVTQDEPWYKGMMAWLIGALVLVAATAGWFLSRRTPGNVVISDMSSRERGSVRELKDEAEKILKVLEPEGKRPADAGSDDQTQVLPPSVVRVGHTENAEILDENSADPEVRLDLARAYIAMGDKEAARVILAEVIEHGDEKQQKEAKGMLGEI